MRHINIPIFIPHLGCPNQCVFCNQRSISGVNRFEADKVDEIIRDALSTVEDDTEVEIAFFGGSFTGIDRSLMIYLLDTAYEYIKSGRASGIRCSTRPDYINAEILEILKSRGVKVIELGLQSSSDTVLTRCKRGHDFECERRACRMIAEAGLELVGQMMIGLPGSDPESELKCAEFIVSSGAVAARIYPTVVFKDTELCQMAADGEYTPISVEEAVERSAKVFRLFLENNIDVIRIGLCSSENLLSNDNYFAGPNHPALGEIVLNRYYLEKILEGVNSLALTDEDILIIKVAPGRLSSAIGQKKRNKLILSERLPVKKIIFSEDECLTGYSVECEMGELKCT